MEKRALKDLINTVDPAWPLVQELVSKARNQVEILPVERQRGEAVLHHLQVTTRSPLGAIALESGGLLIDHGWLRFLGSGHERLQGNLQIWNTSGQIRQGHVLSDALVIAHDVVGGFFAINGGAFPGKPGQVFYFAPDTLSWENTNKSYSSLLEWTLGGDVDLFYKNMRWPDWEYEISNLNGDQGMSIYPFAFLNKELPMEERSRRAVPIYELWHLYRDLTQKLENLPAGTPIRFILDKNSQG